MTRMTGPDCVVMCNLINTHTHTHIIYLVVYIYTVYCKEKSQFAVYVRSTKNIIPRDNITNRDSAMLSGIAM